MTQPVTPVDVERAALAHAARLAAGVLSARCRGDESGATTLSADFGNADERAFGFLMVAELAVTLLAQATGETKDTTAARLSLALAAGLDRS